VKKKILIIEDEKTLRFLLAQKLIEENFDVLEAIDGEEGLQKLKENKIDLILLDLLLPGIDGFEVLSRIERDSKLSSIPVIILSNLGQMEEIEKGLKLGAADYLVKANFTLDEIIAKIRNVLPR
jgi:DNA-binding response OmpR family regulator